MWRWGRWAQLETLTHEYVHLWEQQVGEKKPGHRKQFCEKADPQPDPVRPPHSCSSWAVCFRARTMSASRL
jgi:hypothetical protein